MCCVCRMPSDFVVYLQTHLQDSHAAMQLKAMIEVSNQPARYAGRPGDRGEAGDQLCSVPLASKWRIRTGREFQSIAWEFRRLP